VVWIPPDEKHWHGATPTTAMSHIAVVEELNDSLGDILEKVGDEQYEGSSNADNSVRAVHVAIKIGNEKSASLQRLIVHR
jgi:hypothetical protein